MGNLELIDIFDKASNMFLNKQKELILSGVAERSWYPHFIIYLRKVLEEKNICGYNLDSEYNKNLGKLKTVYDDILIEVIPIVCDVIVHSRGKNLEQDNLICIEKNKNRTPLELIRELDFSLFKRKKDKQMYLKIFTL